MCGKAAHSSDGMDDYRRTHEATLAGASWTSCRTQSVQRPQTPVTPRSRLRSSTVDPDLTASRIRCSLTARQTQTNMHPNNIETHSLSSPSRASLPKARIGTERARGASALLRSGILALGILGWAGATAAPTAPATSTQATPSATAPTGQVHLPPATGQAVTTPVAPASFQDELRRYFAAEKEESALFVALGLAAIVFGWQSLLSGDKFRRGMAGPLLAIGLIQVVVGGSVFLRTDAQVAELLRLYSSAPAEFRQKELPRMETVNRWFDVYAWIEISLIGVGMACVAFSRRKRSQLLLGLGAGLILQSGIMLGLDIFAERRADVYTQKIQALPVSAQSTPTSTPQSLGQVK